jgi:WD40 repeat protein
LLLERLPLGYRHKGAAPFLFLKLWDLATLKGLLTLPTHMDHLDGVCFTADGGTLAAVGSRTRDGKKVGVVEWWDRASGRAGGLAEVPRWDGWNGPPVLAPDGAAVAAVGSDKTARVWDLATGEERACLRGVTGLAFSPDGRTVATASGGADVALRDAATLEEKETLRGQGEAWDVRYAPDGKSLLVTGSGNTLALWDLASRGVRYTLPGKGRAVFAPDGRTLVTFDGNTVTLWQTATGQELLTLRGPGGSSQAWVAFTQNGRALVSLSEPWRDEDRNLAVWPAAADDADPPR